jgi:RNA polymerase sigma-70 factor (ECF subfamily)
MESTTIVECETGSYVDEDLVFVRAAKGGDLNAFEELVRKYDRALLRVAQSIMRNREEAEDVAQEAFLKAFRKLDQFREGAKFSTWLTRIAINECLATLRKRRNSREQSLDTYYVTEGEDTTLEVVDWAPNPEELYSAMEMREILSNSLSTLNPTLRVIFLLRDVEGLSVRETAELLGVTLVAVRTRLFRARLQLRRILTQFFQDSKQVGANGLMSAKLVHSGVSGRLPKTYSSRRGEPNGFTF